MAPLLLLAALGLSSPDCELLISVRAGGAPLQAARVRVAGRRLLTDGSGEANIALPAGKHVVGVAAEGFQAATATVLLEAEGQTRLEIELLPALEEEIIVTATRAERRIQDQPLRVEVVDREDIEEKALMTPGSVAMLLGETTGLRVQTTAPALAAANVRIQGLRGRYSLLLSDGLPLYGVQGNSLSLLQVPPLDLGQVEIIKGAASALYGASALGGVIDLVSQRPKEPQRQALLNASTQSAADATAFLVFPARRRWAYTLIGGLHGQRRQDVDRDGWSDLPGFGRGVLRPRAFWEKGDGSSLFATLGVMAENRRGGSMPASAAPDGSPFAQDLDTRHLDGGAVGRFVLGRRVLSLRGSFTDRDERRRFGADRERGRRSAGFGEIVLNGSAGAHTWLVGAAAQRDAYDARDKDGFDYAFTTPGLFALADVRLFPAATLGLSARLDRHSRYGTFLSPRASILYRPAAGVTLRASGGTGFFAPTPFVEETEETGLSRLRPLLGLSAERARSATLDLGFARGRFDFNATLFGSRVTGAVQRHQVASQAFALANSDGPVRTWGTELLARYRREGFVLLATHAYTRSTEPLPDAPGRREVPLTPGHVATLNAIWEGDWGRFGLEAYSTSRQALEDNPYRERGRGYLLFGALGEHRFGKVRVFVNLENLGNVRQTRWEPLLRPARAPDGRWTVDAWAPLDGFVANGGVRMVF
jgi:iron complex outermembrane receptor protein